jgi:hypothetical protein
LLRRSEQEIVAMGCSGISGTSGPSLLDAVRENARTGTFRHSFASQIAWRAF